MNSIEEIRQTVFSTFKAFHDASYSAVPVNWPNYSTVDAEALTGSFVSVQLAMQSGSEVYDVTALSDIVRGELLVSYLRPTGAGLTGSAEYADMLRTNICQKKLSGIVFFSMKILEVSPAPGIVGQMFVIPFMI